MKRHCYERCYLQDSGTVLLWPVVSSPICKWEVHDDDDGGGGRGGADEEGGQCVRVPITGVLLLPSSHRWPLDPGRGLNVKGRRPGSEQITARPLVRDASPWQRSTHYRRRDGGCFAFCMLNAHTHSPGWACFSFFFRASPTSGQNPDAHMNYWPYFICWDGPTWLPFWSIIGVTVSPERRDQIPLRLCMLITAVIFKMTGLH